MEGGLSSTETQPNYIKMMRVVYYVADCRDVTWLHQKLPPQGARSQLITILHTHKPWAPCSCCFNTTDDDTPVQVEAMTHLVHFNNLRDVDVDDRFSDACYVCVLVNVEHLLRLLNITDCREELPTCVHTTQSSTGYITAHNTVKDWLHHCNIVALAGPESKLHVKT